MLKPKAKRKKQTELPIEGPGVAPVRIKELDDAVLTYVNARDRRMQLTEKEIEAKRDLIHLMHKHEEKLGRDGDGVLRYKYEDEDFVAELKPGDETLKVKKAKEDDLEEE